MGGPRVRRGCFCHSIARKRFLSKDGVRKTDGVWYPAIVAKLLVPTECILTILATNSEEARRSIEGTIIQ